MVCVKGVKYDYKGCEQERPMSRKDQCKVLMTKFFGPHVAKVVDSMSEEDCVAKCKARVRGFLGDEAASEFDSTR
jgi:monoamine oxidase